MLTASSIEFSIQTISYHMDMILEIGGANPNLMLYRQGAKMKPERFL